MELNKLSFLKPFVVPVSVGVAAFAGGIGVGYILGKRKGENVFVYELNMKRTLPEDEAVVERDQFAEAINKPSFSDLIKETPAVKEAVEKVESTLIPLRPDPEDDHDNYQPQKLNVFAHEDDGDWDYEAELQTRSPEAPYVLHRDEFFNEEMGFDQSTLTYYQGDDILVDENDVPIYNYSSIVGELKFGHGSRDKNVVYVRNEKMQGEYEILLSTSHYAVEVLGLEIEDQYQKNDLKHSVRKFRSD